jgi:hypothetical protein
VSLAKLLDSRAAKAMREHRQLMAGCITRGAAAEVWTAVVTTVRDKAEAVPAAEAERLTEATRSGAVAVERSLREAIYALLTDLSSGADASPCAEPKPKPATEPWRRSPTLRIARAQLARAQAALVDVKEQLHRGDLLRVASVTPRWDERVLAFRARLLALPSELAERIVQAARSQGSEGVGEELAAAIAAALADLDWRIEEAHPEPAEDGNAQDKDNGVSKRARAASPHGASAARTPRGNRHATAKGRR